MPCNWCLKKTQIFFKATDILGYRWVIKLINTVSKQSEICSCQRGTCTESSVSHSVALIEATQVVCYCFCFTLFNPSSLTAHFLFALALRLLVDTVVHFPPSLEEVTVSVSDERMWVRNHVEEEGEFFSTFFSTSFFFSAPSSSKRT